MVDGKGKEEDLLVDEVFKYLDVGSIASDRKLRSLCLVMLGSSGCRCGGCITRRRRSWDRDVDSSETSVVRGLCAEVGGECWMAERKEDGLCLDESSRLNDLTMVSLCEPNGHLLGYSTWRHPIVKAERQGNNYQ